MATAPVTLMLLLALVGVVLMVAGRGRHGRAGLACVTTGVLLLLVCGTLPVGTLLLRPLEDRFRAVGADAPAPTGIVVLGGSTDQGISVARGRTTIADAGERITEAVVLARRYPQARLMFSGGSASILGEAQSEAEVTRRLWIDMGIAPERITIEGRSRNTDENARFTAALLRPKPDETWMLLTSAYHMPRAVGLFRANGFPVLAYPVDYRTSGTSADFSINTDVAAGLARLNMAVREWIGLLAYAATGRTRTVFPAP